MTNPSPEPVPLQTNVNINELRARFLRALSNAGVRASGAAVFDELLTRYGERHRRYHTLVHVDDCLGLLDWYRGSAQHPERIELALWFHDAIYDPRANDNERQSAELARARLGSLGVPLTALKEIEAHVLATQSHQAIAPDAELLLDLDLSVLGARSHAYARFEHEVREEYAYVPETQFRAGRSAILRAFLARPEIYRTRALREEFEVRARMNLERRLLELTSLAHA